MTLPRPLGQVELRDLGKSVIVDIQTAFNNVSIEDGVTISEAYAIDSYQTEEVIREARKRDTYSKWQDLDTVSMDPGGSALTFMDPIGFRFHFPAYLIHDIHERIGIGTVQASNCEPLFYLQADGESSLRYFSLFNYEQKRCCALFLVFVAELDYADYFISTSEITHHILEDVYAYGSPLRIMHVSWWRYFSEEEQRHLIHRWTFLNSEPT